MSSTVQMIHSQHFPGLVKLKEEYDQYCVLPYEKEIIFNPLVDKATHDAKYKESRARIAKLSKEEYAILVSKLKDLDARISAFLASAAAGTIKH